MSSLTSSKKRTEEREALIVNTSNSTYPSVFFPFLLEENFIQRTRVAQLPLHNYLKEMNVSEIEELIFEDCRYPFIFQLDDSYRYFRLGFLVFELLYGVVGVWLIVKNRGDGRFVIRSPCTFALLMISYFGIALSYSLRDITTNELSFFNLCESNESIGTFALTGYVCVFSIRVVLYYNGYKLYKAVLNERGSMVSYRTSAESDQQQDKLSKMFYKASHAYAKTLCIMAIGFSLIVATSTVLLNCPVFGEALIDCTYNKEVGNVATVKYALLGLTVIGLVVTVFVKTRSHPDPFGVLGEVKTLMVIYVISFFMALISYQVALQPLEQFNRRMTPIFFTSVTNVLILTVTVMYPSYLISRKKQTVSFTLKQILTNTEAKQLFERHLQREFNLEVLHCYEAILKFESMFENSSDEVLLTLAKNIFTKYISHDTAKFPINISSLVRNNIADKIGNRHLEADMFTSISRSLLANLQFDSYTRFQRGPYYALFIGLSTEDTFDKLTISS